MPNFIRIFHLKKFAKLCAPTTFLLLFLFLLAVIVHSSTIISTYAASSDPCTPPASGDWIVSASCTITGSVIAPASVIVNPGVIVTVSPNSSLEINFKQYKLVVKKTGGILVKKNSTVKQTMNPNTPPLYQLTGLNFSPWIDGQNPETGSPFATEQQIYNRLAIIAKYTKWIRTFGTDRGQDKICLIAKRDFGLKCAMGAWIDQRNEANTTLQVNSLIKAAQDGYVDLAIIGNESLLKNRYDSGEIVKKMQEFKQKVPNVPVTAVDTYGSLLSNPSVIAASDIVMVNYYPFWEQNALDEAIWKLDYWHKLMQAEAGNKPVWVAEAGWPSGGNPFGQAIPSPENASLHFKNFVSWARENNVQYFYFAGLDESWKNLAEGAVGPHWGIWDKNGNMKPGMQAVFNGETSPGNWKRQIPGGVGDPKIEFTSIPTFGATTGTVKGRILHVDPSNYTVAVYIRQDMWHTWWVKPAFIERRILLSPDGLWESRNIGEFDTKIVAFLLPLSYKQPNMISGSSLPAELCQNAVEYIQIQRTQNGNIELSGSPCANP
jgi:exo-beta-1,3-glucanase (GH17 family)